MVMTGGNSHYMRVACEQEQTPANRRLLEETTWLC
jgi:hypothetical protein